LKMAMICELHNDNVLAHTMNSRGAYSTYAPLCTCVAPGDFSSLHLDKTEKDMLSDAYETITSLGLWDWMRDPTTRGDGGFMFSDAPEITKIANAMKYKDLHSGGSFGVTLRTMEMIAVHGWNAYLKTINPCKYQITMRWPDYDGFAKFDTLYDTEEEAQAVVDERTELSKKGGIAVTFEIKRV